MKATPRTDEFISKVQSEPIPFEIAFWQLLELTRTLEVENGRLRKAKRKLKGEVIKITRM